MIALVLLAAVTLGCLLFVIAPLVRSPSSADVVPAVTEAQRERIALRERRDGLYAALRELELEHRTGKLTDEDYVRSRGELRAEALEVLRLLGDDEPAVVDAPALEPRPLAEAAEPS
jgi:hypothetical protein